jgi:hypothetical protein
MYPANSVSPAVFQLGISPPLRKQAFDCATSPLAAEGPHGIRRHGQHADAVTVYQPFQPISGAQVEHLADLRWHNRLAAFCDGALHELSF